jgi:RNA polymerase sigma-70 factor, ECF subfamily
MITDREFTQVWTNACRDRGLTDDLVQQTALQAWEARHHLRPDSNMRAWLFVILRNCHFALLWRPKYEVEVRKALYLENFAVRPTFYAERDLVDVSAALQDLPENQRRALISGSTYNPRRQLVCAERQLSFMH